MPNLESGISLLQEKQKCIINADLDGLLCGALLSNFLKWDIVGFSMCNGSPSDQIWIKQGVDYRDCVYVDLPVVTPGIKAIDQHFCAVTADSLKYLADDSLKINPNILCGKYYLSNEKSNGYTAKYPFGTVHFLIALLGVKGYDVNLNLKKKIENFESFDILLRADRVIGNSYRYRENCKSWVNWLKETQTNPTSRSFGIFEFINRAMDDITNRLASENNVEQFLKAIGCNREDGDCSNMLRTMDFKKLQKIIDWLCLSFDLNTYQIPNDIQPLNILSGYRIQLSRFNASYLKDEIMDDKGIFSYAIVNGHEVSITKFKNNN